ncbi:App1 family protein [Kineococcus rubinsiae]|uniref:App1 family protein n=1 Tax=Kineococcus rubinsiae TaxID=2609562 RepID=UPI001AD943A0|nr:phosphatase domain-containing protein [Kineococcus rubinsiae]
MITPDERRARRVQLRQQARRNYEQLREVDLQSRPGEHSLHRAARIENALKGVVGAGLRRRGYHAHALAFPGYGGPGWVRVLGRVLLGRDEPVTPAPGAPPASVRGWRNFLTVPVAGHEVTVRIGGHERVLTTDRGGYLDQVIDVDLPPGEHELTLTVGLDAAPAEEEVVESVQDDTEGGADLAPELAAARHTGTARVIVVGPEPQLGLLSDIDDTVVVTRLPRPLIAAWNSFVIDERARVPVNGMAELYQQFVEENPGSPVVYLSTGAWNAAPTLARFLSRSGYPEGPLLLTDWGPTNTGWFRDGSAHKRGSLARLAQELPQVTWLLVGDDGQHDPVLYAEFLAAAPERVAAVGIRRLTPAEQLLAGGHPLASPSTPDDSDVCWVSGDNGYELMHRWYRAGVLRRG